MVGFACSSTSQCIVPTASVVIPKYKQTNIDVFNAVATALRSQSDIDHDLTFMLHSSFKQIVLMFIHQRCGVHDMPWWQ